MKQLASKARLVAAACLAAVSAGAAPGVCQERDRPRGGEVSFQGIGVALERDPAGEGYAVVRVVIPQADQDARKGLQKGDVILEVDGRSVQGKRLEEVVGLIRGPAGTPVRLTVRRKGVTTPVTVTVRRKVIRAEQ